MTAEEPAETEGADDLIAFTEADVRAHIKARHPRCPEAVRQGIVERMTARPWTRCRIGRAFGIIATNYVRHALTDYEKLMKTDGLWREEARVVVQAKVIDIIRSWGRKLRRTTDPADREARTATRNSRRRRARARRRAQEAASESVAATSTT